MGLRRFLQLLVDASEDPLRVGEVSDAWVGPDSPRKVTMPMRDLHRLTGADIADETAEEALSLLGFDVEAGNGALTATVPFWRRADVFLSADLVEEVSRIVGFDSIPITLPKNTMPPSAPLPFLKWEAQVREGLLAAGISECVTHGLTSPEAMLRLAGPGAQIVGEGTEQWEKLVVNAAGVYAREALIEPVRLLNPATRDRRVVRMTILPSLLDVVARNFKQSDERLAFFEISRTFFWRNPDDLPYERRTLAVALGGTRVQRSWVNKDPGPFSFFDMKGILSVVMDSLRVSDWSVEAAEHPSLHPGRSAVVRLKGYDVAHFGELHPAVCPEFDLDGERVQVAEVDLDSLFAQASDDVEFRPLPRYPAVLRDLAVVVDREVEAGSIVEVIARAASDILESCRIFDVYQGPQVPDGRKSIALSLTFRSPGATLTQEDASEVVQRIVAALQEKLGASIRE
jgi:phenylalanyl-tRNA synthetase beta chain